MGINDYSISFDVVGFSRVVGVSLWRFVKGRRVVLVAVLRKFLRRF